MPDIEFIFPNLDDNSNENNAHEAADSTPDKPSPEEYSAEQLISGIIDARYVSLDNNNIDVSQFPALRNALGLTSSDTIDSFLSADEDDVQPADDINDQSYPELPKEEPIPSIFEGIGRSDWASFERELMSSKPDITPNSDGSENVCEPEEESEEEEIIDTDYLLDYIDDIEFSGMEAEPLSPIKILRAPSDPYNSSFNDNSSIDEDLPEFEMTSQFLFEKK